MYKERRRRRSTVKGVKRVNPTLGEEEAREVSGAPEQDVAKGSAAAGDSAVDFKDSEDSAGSEESSRATASTEDETEPSLREHLDQALATGFRSVLEAFEGKLAYDRFKEEQIDRLHTELQEHKKDLLARVLRPLIHGLIRLHDDLGRTTEALAAKPPEELTPERFFKTLEGFCDDLVLLLERNGVHPFEAPGQDFDPQRQTAARHVEIAEPDRVGQVAVRLRPGFEQGTALLQKERVAVYVEAPAVPPESPTDHQDVSPAPKPES